jgi:hypothetical protein
MNLKVLKTGALVAALVAAGAVHAQPFNFITGLPDGQTGPLGANSPPPFNFMNGPAAGPAAGPLEVKPAPRATRMRMAPEEGR